MTTAKGAPERTGGGLKAALPVIALIVGVWALLAPYVGLGPDLNAAGKNEVADHVVPGLLMIGMAVAMLVRSRKPAGGGESLFPLVAGGVIALAGLWMTATHLPLVRDARNGLTTNKIMVWHTLPGLVVLVVGILWVVTYWSSAAPED
ncbi:MAG TPA: hypothetical protein VFJ85_05070 [Acidimicrobiales bacterium]|nr:hypothetical protein [Acidimicrobiales bacterium]